MRQRAAPALPHQWPGNVLLRIHPALPVPVSTIELGFPTLLSAEIPGTARARPHYYHQLTLTATNQPQFAPISPFPP
jgi:hypothetical protein